MIHSFKSKLIGSNSLMARMAFMAFFVVFLGGSFQVFSQNLKGKLHRYNSLTSDFLLPRNVDVWVPADFDSSGKTRYAVLYMHDGQNLFQPQYSFGGMEWGIDECMDSLMRLGQIRKTIVVGIWNTSRRFIEYNPAEAFNQLDSVNRKKIIAERGGTSQSDAYLRFIFNELKPFIDSIYPTRPEMKHTFMAGSSMGGLISLYAQCQYSDQLKGVACLSTHWPLSLKEDNAQVARSYVRYFAHHLPNPMQHRIYFDHGTETLDARYAPYQQLMDSLCAESGYSDSKSFKSLVFPGAAHNETAWRARVAIPLLFLLKP